MGRDKQILYFIHQYFKDNQASFMGFKIYLFLIEKRGVDWEENLNLDRSTLIFSYIKSFMSVHHVYK